MLSLQVFRAWRAAYLGSVARQQLLEKCIRRLQKGLLFRAFQAWKDKFGLVDKYHAMKRKVREALRPTKGGTCPALVPRNRPGVQHVKILIGPIPPIICTG